MRKEKTNVYHRKIYQSYTKRIRAHAELCDYRRGYCWFNSAKLSHHSLRNRRRGGGPCFNDFISMRGGMGSC